MEPDEPRREENEHAAGEVSAQPLRAAAADEAEGSGSERPALSGREGRIPRSGLGALLRWASGWALLSWTGRLLLRALGWRREVRIELSNEILSIRRTTLFRGRVIREAEERRSVRTVLAASRQVRYPALHLAVGAFSLAVGVLVGGLFAWDALRFGDRTLLFVASLIFAGAGLDLLLDILVPGRAGRVCLDIRVEQGRGLRLVGVPLGDADRFLNEIAPGLQRPRTRGRGA